LTFLTDHGLIVAGFVHGAFLQMIAAVRAVG
jgi:hypothetical protein